MGTVALHWPRETTWSDRSEDLAAEGSGVYAVPERLEDYYRFRGWEDPPDDFEGEPQDMGAPEHPGDTDPTRDELVESDEDDEGGGGSGN